MLCRNLSIIWKGLDSALLLAFFHCSPLISDLFHTHYIQYTSPSSTYIKLCWCNNTTPVIVHGLKPELQVVHKYLLSDSSCASSSLWGW